MKPRVLLSLSILLLAGIAACKKNNNSNVPVIAFISFTPDSVHAGSLTDTAKLAFGFKDGDGDLGNDATSGKYDVFLRDSRDTTIPILSFIFPPIPDDARDPVNGLDGQGVIALRALYLLPRQDTLHKLHGDTLTYQMWITDRAGNVSDTITTSRLIIRP